VWSNEITATVLDVPNEQVTQVQLYDDDVLFKTATQSPYNFIFDTSSVQCGVHTYYAVATDTSGATATSEDEELTILPTTTLSFDASAFVGAKTFVAFDLNPDGTFASTGNGGNGNLGSSAQVGADCCRPDADPVVGVTLPDFNSHTIGIYALDSDGNLMPGNPVTVLNVPAPSCVNVSPSELSTLR
jgi:hypothetical protein